MLFCAAIRRDSISLLRLPFLSYVQVFSYAMIIIIIIIIIIFIIIIIINLWFKFCQF